MAVVQKMYTSLYTLEQYKHQQHNPNFCRRQVQNLIQNQNGHGPSRDSNRGPRALKPPVSSTGPTHRVCVGMYREGSFFNSALSLLFFLCWIWHDVVRFNVILNKKQNCLLNYSFDIIPKLFATCLGNLPYYIQSHDIYTQNMLCPDVDFIILQDCKR